ncbi:(d)CMP kinase [Thermofilum pendens]|uniref:Cytidylate kinase n=1 Tax=Thermofilum pendens (strain DSM 2475 / Hrk 5) TaxID=368408 RepID=A1RXV0_THEPD|nr:AAA family ATPase [Thermofilum pendens]ABL78030.1 cytidylate kinase, putative [Thermofilum pendens Hrk 5]
METLRLVVAVSGTPGSGKTTYARFIAERYNLRYVSSGSLFREMAKKLGVDLIRLHSMAEENEDIDRAVDSRAIEEAKKGNVVIEGHLAVWLLKDIADVKVIFDAPLEVRARRIAQRESIPLEKALEEIKIREKSNYERARRYYNLDIRDYTVADLVVNTYPLDVEAVKSVVAAFIDGYLRARMRIGV